MLPVPIADGVLNDTLPEHTIQTARELKFFLGENAKSARAFLKFCGHPSPIASLSIEEIGHRPDSAKVRGWLKPALEGNDIGIVSEAGCPGVADPGAQIAAEAHKLGIRVVPLVGPSSILLALMASGMDGQHFRFCGYLPIKEPARTNAIKDLERKSASSEGETQLFIETPYRNSGNTRKIGTAACHEVTADLRDFFKAAAYAVRYRGRFAIVQLPDRFAECMQLAAEFGLQPKRLQWVHSAVHKPAWIFLMEMVKGGSYGLDVLPPLVMYNADGTLSAQTLAYYDKSKEQAK